jgi:hypothetical protein
MTEQQQSAKLLIDDENIIRECLTKVYGDTPKTHTFGTMLMSRKVYAHADLADLMASALHEAIDIHGFTGADFVCHLSHMTDVLPFIAPVLSEDDIEEVIKLARNKYRETVI